MEQYTQQPDAVAVYPLDGSTDLILRKDIVQTETDDGTVWQCEERQLRVPRVLTVEDVAANFDSWWDYTPGADDPDDISTASTPGKEERLEALESAVLEMAGLLPNGDEGDRLNALETATQELADAAAKDDSPARIKKLESELSTQASSMDTLKEELAALKNENAALTEKLAQLSAQAAETEANNG